MAEDSERNREGSSSDRSSSRKKRRRRKKRTRVPARFISVLKLTVFFVAIVPPLLLAGATRLGTLSIGAAALVGLVVAVLVQIKAPSDRQVRLGAIDLAMLTALGFTAAFLIPLPISLLSETLANAYTFVGAESLRPLSFDPGATRRALFIGASATAAYMLGRVAQKHLSLRLVAAAVASSAALIASIAFVHEVLSARALFGVYVPTETSPVLLSPILNSNHFGAFCAFGATLSVALVISTEEKRHQWLASALFALCTMAALGSLSRGAVLGLVAGLGLVTLIVLSRHARRTHLRKRNRRAGKTGGSSKPTRRAVKNTTPPVALFVSAAGLLFLFLLTAYSAVWEEMSTGNLQKIDLIAAAFTASFDHGILGVGRGAFESFFAASATSERFTHPENLFAQWATEWGWPLTLFLTVVFARFLWRALRHRELFASLAAAAIVGFVVHEMFDFALEMPGVLVPFALFLGALVSDTARIRDKTPAHKRIQLMATGAAFGCLLALPWWIWTEDLDAAFDELGNASIDEAKADSLFSAHPLDPRASLLAGYARAQHDNGDALRYLNRTMDLAPSWASPHELAARLLARRGALTQALLEAREAELREAGSARELLCFLGEHANFEELVRIIGTTPASYLSRSLASCMESERSVRFDNSLVSEHGEPTAALRVAARRLSSGEPAAALEALERGQARGAVDSTLETDEVVANEALKWQVKAGVYRVRAYAALSQVDDAIAASEQIQQLLEDTETNNDELIDQSLAARAYALSARGATHPAESVEWTRTGQALDDVLLEMRRRNAGSASDIADVWTIAAEAYQRMDRSGEALEALENAHRLDSTRQRAWAIVRQARRLEMRSIAASWLRRLCSDGDERACEERR